MRKERKLKEIEDSELWIQRKLKEYTDKQGRNVIEFRWEKSDREENLGSLMNPNKDILGFKYVVPSDKPKNIFGKIFGGDTE